MGLSFQVKTISHLIFSLTYSFFEVSYVAPLDCANMSNSASGLAFTGVVGWADLLPPTCMPMSANRKHGKFELYFTNTLIRKEQHEIKSYSICWSPLRDLRRFGRHRSPDLWAPPSRGRMPAGSIWPNDFFHTCCTCNQKIMPYNKKLKRICYGS